MGLLRRLFGMPPSDESKGIILDLTQPFWKLDGETDFSTLLRALISFLPQGCVLCFEGGSPRGKLLEYFDSHRIEEQTRVAVGTLWPRPVYYHIPATAENLSGLAEHAEHVAEPEIALHFHVYCNGEIILEWHDAFTQPMLLAGSLEESKVRALGKELNMRVTKWKNASEQAVGAGHPTTR